MQWKSVLPLTSGSWEPLELRELKKELANINCGCSFCEKYRDSTKFWQRQISVEDLYKDEEVQSEYGEESLKPDVPCLVNNETITEDSYLPTTNKPSSSRDQMCPSCMFTLNLFRSGTTKILKDEETEAKPERFACDKGTSKVVKCLEKTTSYCKPLLKYLNNGLFSAVTSQDSINSTNRCLREVKFAFKDQYYAYDDDVNLSEQTTPEKNIDESAEKLEEEDKIASPLLETTSEDMQISDAPQTPLCVHFIDYNVDINEYINSIRPPFHTSQ